MPRTVTVTLQDGKTHVYNNVPDDVTPDAITARVSQEFGSAPTAIDGGRSSSPEGPKREVGAVEDAIRSVPGALAKGITGIVGLPGDVERGLTWLADKATGVTPEERKSADSARPGLPLPTSEVLNNTVSAPFSGMYEPQTTAGKYADTIGQFAPAAAAPGTLATRLARVLVPGGTSEAAGQAAEGTALEIPARIGGALLGAGAIGGARQALQPRAGAPPTTEQLRGLASAAYDRAHNAGVVIPQDRVQQMAAALRGEMRTEGLDPTLHPRATAALGRLEGIADNQSLRDMDVLRRVARGAAGSNDRDERRLGRALVGGIDDFVENLGPSDVLSGNAPEATAALGEARRLYSRTARAETIDRLMERAATRAETVGGSGLENAIRVEFRQLAQNERRMRGFSPDEQEAIRNVARGGPIGNASRLVGKLAPTNAMTILGSLGATAINPLAASVPAAGLLGRGVATAITQRNARLAQELMRRGEVAPAQPRVWSPELITAVLGRNQRENQQPALQGAY